MTRTGDREIGAVSGRVGMYAVPVKTKTFFEQKQNEKMNARNPFVTRQLTPGKSRQLSRSLSRLIGCVARQIVIRC